MPVLGYVTEGHHFCTESQSDATWFVASRKKTSLVRGDTINIIIGKGKVCIQAKWPIRPELIPVSVA